MEDNQTYGQTKQKRKKLQLNNRLKHASQNSEVRLKQETSRKSLADLACIEVGVNPDHFHEESKAQSIYNRLQLNPSDAELPQATLIPNESQYSHYSLKHMLGALRDSSRSLAIDHSSTRDKRKIYH